MLNDPDKREAALKAWNVQLACAAPKLLTDTRRVALQQIYGLSVPEPDKSAQNRALPQPR